MSSFSEFNEGFILALTFFLKLGALRWAFSVDMEVNGM